MPRPSRRHEVFEYLKANPTEFSINELCEALDMSYGVCRNHCLALVDAGEITKTTLPTGKPGQPPMGFMYVG